MPSDIPFLLIFEATHPILLGLACLANISAMSAALMGTVLVFTGVLSSPDAPPAATDAWP